MNPLKLFKFVNLIKFYILIYFYIFLMYYDNINVDILVD